MDYSLRDWQVDWKRVGDYLLGRSTLIGIASLMLLFISGYATWHGMRDFIVGVSASSARSDPPGCRSPTTCWSCWS